MKNKNMDNLNDSLRRSPTPININSKPPTMKEVNRNWDDWWNSLTDSQKQKLVEEQEAMEKQRENEQR